MLEGAAMKIASFNVQVFGAKKMENKMVKNVLIKVTNFNIIRSSWDMGSCITKAGRVITLPTFH